MAESSIFEMFEVFPPGRDGRVVQLTVRRDAMVDIPAELHRLGDETTITLISRSDGIAWEYRLPDFLEALNAAVEVLDRSV